MTKKMDKEKEKNGKNVEIQFYNTSGLCWILFCFMLEDDLLFSKAE